MNGQFIGTANTNELEELQEDGAAQNGENGAAEPNNGQPQDGGETEEMMLLDDDDDLLLPETNNNKVAGHARDGGNREI